MLPGQSNPSQPPQAAPSAPGKMLVSDVIRANWKRLTPEEQEILKDAVTMENMPAFCKLLGHDIKPLLEPLVQDELGGGDLEYDEELSAGPEAVPYGSTSIRQVKAMGY